MRQIRSRSGGLLVELLMASAIFIVITQVFFTLDRQKMVSIRMAEDRTIAARAADLELDRLRSLPAEELARLDGHAFAVHGLSAGDRTPGTIRVEPAIGHPSLRLVTVTIEWTGEPGRPTQSTSLAALIHPRDAR